MYCNGAQVRKLRAQLGYTQEKLAAMSDVTIRTVQRAENSEPLELETFNQLAQALKTTPLAIQNRRAGEADREENGFVVLRPTVEGAKLVLAIRKSFEAVIEFDAEPTDETIEPMVSLVEKLRQVSPYRWDYGWVVNGDGVPSDTEVLRIQLDVTKLIGQLALNGVEVYFGSYFAARQTPNVSEEGELYVSARQKANRETVVRVRISEGGLDRIKIAVADEWVAEPEPIRSRSGDFDDEIPF